MSLSKYSPSALVSAGLVACSLLLISVSVYAMLGHSEQEPLHVDAATCTGLLGHPAQPLTVKIGIENKANYPVRIVGIESC